MQWFTFFLFLLISFHIGEVSTAPAPTIDHGVVDVIATLDKRQNAATTAANNVTQTHAKTAANTQATAPSTNTTGTSSNTTTSNAGHTNYVATVPSVNGPTSDNQVAANGTKSVYNGGLPIEPQLTPALGVGGVILLVFGGAFAIIGIRKQWLYIYLSTGFLAALGVTALIIYVMNSPVSNSVQGGYLVAIFFTGAIFGGLAFVFREITEGLGCLLGGFCIGMWLLTLKSGGLVTGTGARAGLIVACTVAFYCLSFSHYTRSYGVILCTAFAGATALVLGIDCFTRAGLKEFWLYLWGLNMNMFPLNTYTYPVTRNIKVEIAGVVIVTVFGVIAQLRLWKVIKMHRAREDKAREKAERKKDAAEAEVGRRLEKNNDRERAEWEHVYGNRTDVKAPSLTETAVADESRRGSDGCGGSQGEQENGNSFAMKDPTNVEHSAEVPDDGKPRETAEEVTPNSVDDAQTRQVREEDPREVEHVHQETLRRESFVSHKPFDTASISDGDDSEHGAVLGSEIGTPRSSKRFSTQSWGSRLSWRSGQSGLPKLRSNSEEALVPGDATSSVAGVVDDLESVDSRQASIDLDDHNGSEPNQQVETKGEIEYNKSDLGESKDLEQTSGADDDDAKKGTGALEEEPRSWQPSPSEGCDSDMTSMKTAIEEKSPKEPTSEDQQPVVTKPEDFTVEIPVRPCESVGEVGTGDSASQTQTLERAKRATLDMTTVQSIPEQTSKVVHSFRTKEWAKHLADAEGPEVEPLHSTETEETPTPVNVDGLLRTAFNAQPPPIVKGPEQNSPSTENDRRESYSSPSHSPGISRPQSRSSVQDVSTLSSQPQPLPRSFSSASLPRQEEGSTVSPMQRSTSTSFLTVTRPPSRNKQEDTANSPRWRGPPLLAIRENRLRNRMSSTSPRYPYSTRGQSRQSFVESTRISPTFSIPEERDEDIEELQSELHATEEDADNIPLSRRRALLQRQTMRSPSTASQQSYGRADSPQWSPVETGKSSQHMASWRQSIREDLQQKRDPLAYQSPSSPASPDKPSSMWGSVQQMRDASATRVDNAIAEGMRRGSMTDLHRQAMRRMQASANRQL